LFMGDIKKARRRTFSTFLLGQHSDGPAVQ
jgi:hypothetical protein